jgi:hypothetical protein
MNNICNYVGCSETPDTAHRFFNGILYCKTHYFHLITNELLTEFNKWQKMTEPNARFKYYLGRSSSELPWPIVGDSFLSKNRIETRAFNFNKTETGCTFEIARHLNSWGEHGKPKTIVEKWEADVISQQLTVLGTRKFKKGDFDPL